MPSIQLVFDVSGAKMGARMHPLCAHPAPAGEAEHAEREQRCASGLRNRGGHIVAESNGTGSGLLIEVDRACTAATADRDADPSGGLVGQDDSKAVLKIEGSTGGNTAAPGEHH